MLINDRLDYWKKRLLDLGKRNRLINCPLPNSEKRVQRHSLLISAPSSADLWELLAEDDGELSFDLPLDLQMGKESDEQFKLFEIESDVTNSFVRTNQTQNETHKTLRSLMKKTKEFTEEKGLNALHLAFGFLNWKENGTEGQDLRSPLLLLPVKLSQEDLFSPIILSRSDEEMTANHSLEQKLLSDFNIVIPSPTEDTKLSDYLQDVSQIVGTLGWNVSDDAVQLSLFSFMKINMYRDLERNSKKICEHRVIRGINGEAFHDVTNLSEVITYDHDNTDPQEVFSVVDADSSQQDAILLAKKGASFILQGPPGTGKSQTITNIIAELIADGKKVLFVSEKMAALDVVFKRLTKEGIGDFCLTLHSHNAKRREILGQFERIIKISRMKVEIQEDAYNKLCRLKETRDALNRYNTELHTVVEPLGKTIYQVNGFLAQLEDCRNIDFVQVGAEAFTPKLLAQCESALEEVARIVEKSGYQQSNPWGGCLLMQQPTFEFRQRFLTDAAHLIALIEEGLSILAETNEIFDNNNLVWRLGEIASVKRIFDMAKLSPGVNSVWMGLNLQSTLSNLDACINDLGACKALESELSAIKTDYECISLAMHAETAVQFEQASKTEKIRNAVDDYNRTLEAKQSLSMERANLVVAREETEKELLNAEQILKSEQAESDRAKLDWQRAQNSLLERCAESVLLLDTSSILARYRTNYRSWTRFFRPAYRRDRQNLLVHCKTAEGLPYEDGLLLLDAIANVKVLKITFDQRAEATSRAQALFEETKHDYDSASKKLNSATEALDCAAADLDTAKRALARVMPRAISDLEQELCEKKRLFPLSQDCVSLRENLGMDVTEDINFAPLRSALTWCAEFQNLTNQYRFGNVFVNAVCARDSNTFSKADSNIKKLQDWAKIVTEGVANFAALFDEQGTRAIYNMHLNQLLAHITDCKDNFASLEYLIDYRNVSARLKLLGINVFLEKAKEISLKADEIVPVFKKCFFRSWLDAVIPTYGAVNDFRSLRQEERISLFKDLDKSHLAISKAMLISKLLSCLPNFDAYSSNGEMALLRREMTKQRKLMPTRRLIAALPNLLPVLKPCLMMSPLSVSTYLGSSDFVFDTVIFDEASQVRTEDAIGAIFRAKQVVIAGDSKQLPPTDFFNSSMSTPDEFEEDDEGEINDTGAYESLLDEATMLPIQTLLWHYRSRHEDLIAFSNAKIYGGNLITFPSSVEKMDGMGVEYVYVSGGIYDRGGKNGNKVEAEKVAEIVFEHFRNYPKRSLGIIAFGEVQQSTIQDALIAKRRANPDFESFFKEDKEESLFVKNLETVQGDERDTIIFSIGYAPDPLGKFIMNFGPLSRDGGERRLNVAVTRARYNLKLIGSIMPTDIDIERTSGQGPKLLRLYIDFAINGANAIRGEVTTNSNSWHDSPFELSVHQFLTSKGFDVVTQVGCSGYRIDMAVRHPRYNGRFALGIECDGAMYHSARTARERDRLRQTILEDMGWNIYRVWSTDWIKDRHTEGERLLGAVKRAIEDYWETTPSLNRIEEKLTDFANIHVQTKTEHMRKGRIEKFQTLRSRYYRGNAKEVPVADIASVMIKVINANFGLDKMELFKETALYGYGWERQGNVIKSKFEDAYTKLVQQNRIVECSDGKLKLKGAFAP